MRAARAAGYRSRASYKLLQIHAEHKLLQRGMSVVDLGAAPGGWSQVAAEKVGAAGRVLAADKLAMPSLAGVAFIQGDFTAEEMCAEMLAAAGVADVVLSDMAPNISGIAVRDQANAQELFEAALNYCGRGGLKTGGDFLVKIFAGEMQNECRAILRARFSAVKTIIPPATRKTSRECYLLARGFLM